eukprot:677365-Prorocentrum_minimum.AAC.5
MLSAESPHNRNNTWFPATARRVQPSLSPSPELATLATLAGDKISVASARAAEPVPKLWGSKPPSSSDDVDIADMVDNNVEENAKNNADNSYADGGADDEPTGRASKEATEILSRRVAELDAAVRSMKRRGVVMETDPDAQK